MDRSLNIPKTDALVWDAIKEVVKHSVTLKERVKTEVLRQKQETDLVSDDAIRKLDTTENRLNRELKNVKQSIAKVETDHMLGKTDDTIYENILQNLNAELNSLEAQLAQLDIQKREATSEKRWVDWVRRYEEQYQNLENLSEIDKKAYIEALVMRLVVHLDGDTKEHTLDVEFSLPIVGDQLVYKDPKKKSLGYDIIDGESVLAITADFQDRGGVKKKDLGANS
jgi:prefoldin subunit 5